MSGVQIPSATPSICNSLRHNKLRQIPRAKYSGDFLCPNVAKGCVVIFSLTNFYFPSENLRVFILCDVRVFGSELAKYSRIGLVVSSQRFQHIIKYTIIIESRKKAETSLPLFRVYFSIILSVSCFVDVFINPIWEVREFDYKA